jgi:DNA-binding transcriptional MerR regulator
MRIGELARRTGVSRDTIRLYERSGLIDSPAREADNGYKRYPESAVYTLETIRDAQAAGLSLDDLAMLMRQIAAADAEDFDGDAFLAAKIAEVEARIAASTRFLHTLHQTRAALARAPLPDRND